MQALVAFLSEQVQQERSANGHKIIPTKRQEQIKRMKRQRKIKWKTTHADSCYNVITNATVQYDNYFTQVSPSIGANGRVRTFSL